MKALETARRRKAVALLFCENVRSSRQNFRPRTATCKSKDEGLTDRRRKCYEKLERMLGVTPNRRKMADVFERNILRRIRVSAKERDQWRCGYYKETYGLFKVLIRSARLRWAGHVKRIDEICVSRRLK
jgi:hypothetical protein